MVNDLLQSIAGKASKASSPPGAWEPHFGKRDLPPVFSSQPRTGEGPAKVCAGQKDESWIRGCQHRAGGTSVVDLSCGSAEKPKLPSNNMYEV